MKPFTSQPDLGQTPSKIYPTGGTLIKCRLASQERTCRVAQFSYPVEGKIHWVLVIIRFSVLFPKLPELSLTLELWR